MTAAAAPLVIDGSIDQRHELAELLVALDGERRHLTSDYDRVTAILRLAMLAAKIRSIAVVGATVELRPGRSWWCCVHKTPPPYCENKHDAGEPIAVYEVPAEPYLSIRRSHGQEFA